MFKQSSFLISFVVLLVDLHLNQAQNCPTFWTGHGSSCYRFRFKNYKPWQDAQKWCKAQNADLVKLETSEERDWIINQTNVIDTNNVDTGDTEWWIGLNDIKTSSQWVWGDGSRVDYSVIAWSPGGLDSSDGDCAGVNYDRVSSRMCAIYSKYICERSRGARLPCDADKHYQTFNGFCYKVHLELQTWNDAKKTCDNEGAYLATVDNAMDETVLFDFAVNNGQPFWIGLHSVPTKHPDIIYFLSKGNGPVSWIWDSNITFSLTYWSSNQPQVDNNQKNSSCVYITNTTTTNTATNENAWVVDWCGRRKSFICKKTEGVCPSGWIAHQQKCYQFNIQYKYSWPHAESYCNAQGSTLVHIYGDAATYFLQSYFGQLSAAGIDSIWIGIFDNNTDSGNFTYSDGNDIGIYKRWLQDPPVNTKGHLDCVYLSTSDQNAYWRPTGSCFVKKAFVCAVNIWNSSLIIPVSTPRPSYTCNDTWILHGYKCYQFNDARMSWSSARSSCQVQQGDLVKITNDDLQGFITSNTHNEEYWIGMNDRAKEGTFVWLDETTPDPSNYTRWNPTEPNNLNSENCVEIRGNGWNDKDCSTKLKYICQTNARNYQLPPQSTNPPKPYSAKCGELWEEDPNSNYCYMFNTDTLDWEDSREICKSKGGDLLSIQSREESFYINARVASMTSTSTFNSFWIGANDRSSEGGWRWSDGSAFAYLNWKPGEPNDLKNNEDCALLLSNSQQHTTLWNDADCTLRLGYICKKLVLWFFRPTTPSPSTLPTPPPGQLYGCPLFWKPYGQYCFRVMKKKVTWSDARTKCGLIGGSLASINSDDEQNFVYSQLRSIGYSHVWIGLNDIVTDMNFKWIDGSKVTYTNWAPREPNNFMNTRENCVNMATFGNGMWNDAPCDNIIYVNGFVCKMTKQLMSSTPRPENVGCTLPAVGYGSWCYYPEAAQSKIWVQADADCTKRFNGGHLAAINDRYTQSFLSGYLPNRDDSFWIGLSETVTQGTYKWVNGWPVSFTFWSASHTGNEMNKCVVMRNDHPRGLWENKYCGESHHYWCQYPRVGHSTSPTPSTSTNTGTCPSAWHGFQSNCYKAYNPHSTANQKTWMEARDFCQSIGANLASIHSQAENDFFSRTVLRAYTTQFWIGLNDRDNENGYVWIDGTPTDFTHWYTGEPNDFKSTEDCVEFSAFTKRWNDNNCYMSNSFVCKIAKGTALLTTAAPPTAVTSSVCGSDLDWFYYNGSCYYISSRSVGIMSAFDSNRFCNQRGAYLASIHSMEENNLLFSKVTKTTMNKFWIGLNELSSNSFTWMDKTVVDFDYWSPGEPNDAYGGERCVVMVSRAGLWNDDSCNENYGFICRKSPSSHNTITPSPTPLINGGCDHGFFGMRFGNKCFLITMSPALTWTAAKRNCRSYGPGYDIASIDSAAEEAFLIANMKGLVGNSVWIGLNYHQPGHFSWQDKSPFKYQNWAPGQPNGNHGTHYYRPREDCVELFLPANPLISSTSIGKWNDLACSGTLGYICEGQKVPGSPVATPGSQCKSGYLPYDVGCYKIFARASWESAATFCSLNGGSLTSIIDVFEESFIKSVYLFTNNSIWIGMTYSKGLYSWLDGWPVSYTNWGSGQPLKGTNGGCVAMVNGQWKDQDCNSHYNYVCKITSAIPPLTTPPPRGKCLDGQVLHKDHCYQGDVFASKSWPEANYICQKQGMNLISIHSPEEVSFIFKQFIAGKPKPSGFHGTPPNIWIGMNKGLSDGFTWTDSTPVNFLNWGPNEPSDPINSTQNECVEMYRNSGKWNDVTCYISCGYLCKSLAILPTTQVTTNRATSTQRHATHITVAPSTPYTQQPGTTKTQITHRVETQIPNSTPNPLPSNPIVPTYSGPQGQGNSRVSGKSNDLSTGGIAAIIVSVVFILIIVGLVAIMLKRRLAGTGYGIGVGGIDNSLYYTKSNEQVNITSDTPNGHSDTSYGNEEYA